MMETGWSAVRPGRVARLYRDKDGGLSGRWLYVIAPTADNDGPSGAYGVSFNNDGNQTAAAAGARFEQATRAMLTGDYQPDPVSHPVNAVPAWNALLADFLSAPETFPEVTPKVALPVPTDGDTVPVTLIKSRLEEAARIASDYAERNELCGEFERCIEAIGLQEWGLTSQRRREECHTVEVVTTVNVPTTVRTRVYVDAYDEEDADTRIRDNGVTAFVSRYSSWEDEDGSPIDVDWSDVADALSSDYDLEPLGVEG